MTPVRLNSAGTTADGLFLNVLWGLDSLGGNNVFYAMFTVTPATIPGDITVLIGGAATTLVANRTHPTEDFSVYLYRRSSVPAGSPVFVDVTFAANRTSFSGYAVEYEPVLLADPFRLTVQDDFTAVNAAAEVFAGSTDDVPLFIWGYLDGSVAAIAGPGETVLNSQGAGVYLHVTERPGDVTVPSSVTLADEGVRGLVVLGGAARNASGATIDLAGELTCGAVLAGQLKGTWAMTGAFTVDALLSGSLRVTDVVALSGALTCSPVISGSLTRSRSGARMDDLVTELGTQSERLEFGQDRLDRRVPV